MDSRFLAVYSLSLVTASLILASAFSNCDTGPLHKIIATGQELVKSQQALASAGVTAAREQYVKAETETNALRDKYSKALAEADALKKTLAEKLKSCGR